MNIIALICAREIQKVLKINLLKFKNTTLIGNAIKQAFKSKFISRVVVSTDSRKIIKSQLNIMQKFLL